MKNKLKTSIVLYGTITAREKELWEWYEYTLKLNEEFGFLSTHLGIIGESYKSGKLSTITRTEKRLRNSLENGEEIESLSIYSLPQEFTQAAFDFNTEICMNLREDNPFVIITVPSEIFDRVNVEEIVSVLGSFIKCIEGEIFELSVFESPLLYASKVNESSDFESLKILKRIKF